MNNLTNPFRCFVKPRLFIKSTKQIYFHKLVILYIRLRVNVDIKLMYVIILLNNKFKFKIKLNELKNVQSL